jgi:hypothetical protein
MECSEEYREAILQPTMLDVVPARRAPSRHERIVRIDEGRLRLSSDGDSEGSRRPQRIKEAYIGAFNAMAEQLQQIGMSLWQQRLELEKTDATSFMWASFGAKRMLDRKKALPEIRETRERLLAEMEPALFAHPELTH